MNNRKNKLLIMKNKISYAEENKLLKIRLINSKTSSNRLINY